MIESEIREDVEPRQLEAGFKSVDLLSGEAGFEVLQPVILEDPAADSDEELAPGPLAKLSLSARLRQPSWWCELFR